MEVSKEAAQSNAPKKIFCFNNGGNPGLLDAVAIAEDGTCVAGHCCSHEVYMKHDLGISSTWKHEHYDAHYGAGKWELEWVENPGEHAGLSEAIRLNHLQGEADEVQS